MTDRDGFVEQSLELIGRLETAAEGFRHTADQMAKSLTAAYRFGASGEIRDVHADRLADFAETILAILRATPEGMRKPEPPAILKACTQDKPGEVK